MSGADRMNYLGDFAEDSTVYIPFNTFSSDDPAASVTITNLADADIMSRVDAPGDRGLDRMAVDLDDIVIGAAGVAMVHMGQKKHDRSEDKLSSNLQDIQSILLREARLEVRKQ